MAEDAPNLIETILDRYTNYSNALTGALAHARQVVDRWHLLKKLCEGLHKLVERNLQHLKYARKRKYNVLGELTKSKEKMLQLKVNQRQ